MLKVSAARKIIAREGFGWASYQDLALIINSINRKEHYVLYKAIKRVMEYLTKGR